MLLSIIPSFTPLNTSNSYLVEELDIRDIDNKIIKNAFKDTFSFTNLLKPLPKK
jgi:hypothetical protein